MEGTLVVVAAAVMEAAEKVAVANQEERRHRKSSMIMGSFTSAPAVVVNSPSMVVIRPCRHVHSNCGGRPWILEKKTFHFHERRTIFQSSNVFLTSIIFVVSW